MKKNFGFGIIIIAVVGVILFLTIQQRQLPEEKLQQVAISRMNLTSSAFTHNGTIPSKYTCDGENVSPPLTISDVSEEVKSLVLIVDDPDAPIGTFVHWVVWNIDPATSEISEGSAPAGAQQGLTDFGMAGYGGPCPPSGTHRYFFKLYALDNTLDLSASTTKGEVERAAEGHILAQTELIGLYSRQR